MTVHARSHMMRDRDLALAPPRIASTGFVGLSRTLAKAASSCGSSKGGKVAREQTGTGRRSRNGPTRET
eukprot:3439790-Pleurochrysis_carterae.AAC.1